MSRTDNGEQASRREQRGGIVDRLRALIGLGSPSVREDIEEALEGSAGDVTPHERVLLKNVLALHDLRVADTMIPRADIVAASQDATLGETLALFRNAGHSRLPVYGDTLDDPRGMIHIRDFVDYLASLAERAEPAAAGAPQEPTSEHAPTVSLAAIDFSATLATVAVLKPVLYVPPSMPALDLLVRMQATRTHLALVIDEYGGTDGLASLEDIVEMVVGDIEDEHDDDEPMITQTGDGVFVVDGKAEIDEVAKMIGEDFAAGEHGEYVDTIGGMIFNTLGRVPARGEVVQAIPGFEFHVLDADPRRVKRVRIVQSQKGERQRRRAARAEQA